jgi:HEAT repeat protein
MSLERLADFRDGGCCGRMNARDWRTLPPSLSARAARKFGDVGFLVGLLSSPEPMARVSAAKQLGKLRDKRSIPALIRCLETADAEFGGATVKKPGREADAAELVRTAARRALKKIGDPV